MYRAYVSFDFLKILLKYRETTYFLLNSYRHSLCVYYKSISYLVFGICTLLIVTCTYLYLR